jgi:threonine dehydrogenase-like Zn-dependent dehydrogenase
MVEPMGVALHGVLRRPPEPGQQVLIVGAGIIGLLSLQAVKAVEPAAEVSVMARYPHQVEAAQRLGADRILSDADSYQAVAEATGGKLYRAPMNRGMILGGYDVIYDCVGSAQTVGDSLRWARARGAVVLVGIDLGVLKVDLNPVWYQEVDLIGSYASGIEHWRGRTIHTFDLVIEMLQEGVLTTQGLITHRFPLSDVKQAVSTALDKRTGAIKVTLETNRGGR